MDAPTVETIVSSASLDEDVDIKKTAADVIEEKVEESPTPPTEEPRHTSPDLSFASEVTLQNGDLQKIRYRYKQQDITPSHLTENYQNKV